MNGKQKLFLIILGMVMIIVAVRFGLEQLAPSDEITQQTEVTTSQEVTESEEEKVEKVYINVFFIGQNENHEEVYKAVKREYNEDIDGSKLKFAVNSLISGPKVNERSKGVYTEIPAGTTVIWVKEFPDKAIINLSSEFTNGGGTDSVYKRLYQLIKTVKRNSSVPVYLYINGQQADVIGGDGIMISQPLSDRSLDG